MAYVGLEKLAEICESEGTEAYLVTWKDVAELCIEKNVELLIGAILEGITNEQQIDPITLPPKYADFADIFDKCRADILAEHSQHDLAIEIEEDKVLFFSPLYDHSKPELKVLCEYINEMFEKEFIVPFKSLLGAWCFSQKRVTKVCNYA